MLVASNCLKASYRGAVSEGVMELEMPPSYHLADQISLSGQNSSIRNIRIQLFASARGRGRQCRILEGGTVDVAALPPERHSLAPR